MPPLRKVPWISTGWFFGGYLWKPVPDVQVCDTSNQLCLWDEEGSLPHPHYQRFPGQLCHHQILFQVLPLALDVFCRHLIQWWFGSSLLGFAPINKHVNLMNISISLFSPRFDTFDWAKRQTIQNEIHFKLKPNFPLCSKGKDARLFRTNFLLITIEKKRCETQSSWWILFTAKDFHGAFPLVSTFQLKKWDPVIPTCMGDDFHET